MELFTSRERELLKELLLERFGLEFEAHRHGVLDSALSARMKLCGIHSAEAYRRHIATDKSELDRLVDSATNNLSRFFRNEPQLRTITDYIIPEFERAETGSATPGPHRDLSIWVAGCATGEEPYTLAMALMGSLTGPWGFRITATDISRRALDQALSGVYPPSRTGGVPAPIRERHFTVAGDNLRVAEDVRSHVSFAWHNLMEPPVLNSVDIILCRNVLTYLSRGARRIVMEHFRESASPGAFLLIGNSETLPSRSGFVTVRTPWARVYRRTCPPPGRTLP